MSNQANVNNDDEIDLLELFKVLWDAKITIIAIGLIVGVLALGATFLMTEKWTSNAIIGKEENINTNLSKRISQLTLITEQEPNFGEKYTNDYLLSNFLTQYGSIDNKSAFMAVEPAFKDKLNEIKSLDERSQKIALKKEAEKLLLQKVKDDNYTGYRVSFTAQTPEIAQQVLTRYINYINNKINTKLNNDITSEMDLINSALDLEYKLEYSRFSNTQNVKIKKLNDVLSIAKKAQIKNIIDKPITIQDNSLATIYLGSDAINKTIEIEKAKTDPLDSSLILQELKLKLDTLKLMSTENIDVDAIDILSAPSEPLTKDAPKKGLMAIIATLMGLILASGGVLLRHSLRDTTKA